MNEHIVPVLLGIAGVAATFAGFSGVVAALDRRARGDWFPEERFRLMNMVVISLGTCLFTFVPLAEELFGLSKSTLWVTASILMGAFCAVYVLYAIPLRRRVGRSRPGSLPLWSTVVFVLCLCSAAALQALNATAILVERGAGLYVAGLLLLLVAAGIQFAFLVLAPLSPKNTKEHNA
jgi:hypothetical protein